MVIRGAIRIAEKIVVAMGALLVLSACAAGIGALAAGGVLGAVAATETKPHPPPARHSPPHRSTDHSPTLLPATPNY